MRDSEHVDQYIKDLLLERFRRVTGKKVAWSLETKGEHEGLSDSQIGEMVVVLLVVSDFSSITLTHLFCRDSSVIDISVDSEVSSSLIRNSLEECSASRSRSTENETELSWFEATVERFEKISRRRLERTGLCDFPEFDDGPENCLLDGIGKGTNEDLAQMQTSFVSNPNRFRKEPKVKEVLTFIPPAPTTVRSDHDTPTTLRCIPASSAFDCCPRR